MFITSPVTTLGQDDLDSDFCCSDALVLFLVCDDITCLSCDIVADLTSDVTADLTCDVTADLTCDVIPSG